MAVVRFRDGSVLVGQAAKEYNRAIKKAMEDPEVKIDPHYFQRIRDYCKNVSLDGVHWDERDETPVEDQTHPWED